jgi:hydrogenase maturation factor
MRPVHHYQDSFKSLDNIKEIIEEGLPPKDLTLIVESMAGEAFEAGVRIVTGDNKVVGKGKCDKLFITTSGIGFLRSLSLLSGKQ